MKNTTTQDKDNEKIVQAWPSNWRRECAALFAGRIIKYAPWHKMFEAVQIARKYARGEVTIEQLKDAYIEMQTIRDVLLTDLSDVEKAIKIDVRYFQFVQARILAFHGGRCAVENCLQPEGASGFRFSAWPAWETDAVAFGEQAKGLGKREGMSRLRRFFADFRLIKKLDLQYEQELEKEGKEQTKIVNQLLVLYERSPNIPDMHVVDSHMRKLGQ